MTRRFDPTMLSHLPCCAGYLALQLQLSKTIAHDLRLVPQLPPNIVHELDPDLCGQDIRIDVQFLAIDEVLGASRQHTGGQRRVHRVAVHNYVQSLGMIDRLRMGPVWMPLLLSARALGGGLRISYVSVVQHNTIATGRRDVLPGSCSVWPLVHLTAYPSDQYTHPETRSLPVDAQWDNAGRCAPRLSCTASHAASLRVAWVQSVTCRSSCW